MNIQTKTTLLFTTLTAAVFLVLAGTVYYFSNQFVYNDFHKRLELRARISVKFIFEKDHVSTESFKQIQKQYLERLADEDTYSIKIAPDGKPLSEVPPGLPQSYLDRIRLANGATEYYQRNFVHYAGLLHKDATGQFLVIESAVNTYGSDIMRRLKNILIITLTSSIVIIYSVGLYFSRKTFQPFRYINTRVQAISEGNLHLRLDIHQGSDEVAELINTFNTMLDRLETAFEAQNNFISNASHELRTPLTAIVAEADYALHQQRSAEVYQQSLGNIVQQAEKLQQLTRGLLSLAQISFDGRTQAWGKLRADQLLFDVKENVDAIFPHRVMIDLPELPENDEDICIMGNQDLLKIAIGNIVLNACKYSGDQPVQVQLAILKRKAVITVTDKGIGIPQDEIGRVYDPFFRASNAKIFEGYGIGVPLTGNIIRLHHGKINFSSKLNEGTQVIITLPIGG